jgi:hypothetical protein
MNINEVVNCDDLSNIFELIRNNHKKELGILLRKLSLPKMEDDNYISFMGCKFNVVLLIHCEAKPNEIISGFNILRKYIEIENYTNALFFRTLDSLLNRYRNKIEVSNDLQIDNIIEPEIMEILRFYYWINKCENLMGKENIQMKLTEIGNDLKLGLKSKGNIKNMFLSYGRIMQDETIPYEMREKFEKELYDKLDPFRESISSFLSEFMLAGLVRLEGYDSQFISTEESKTCDLLVNSYKTEVKTILDRNRQENRIEEKLEQEIELTLKRTKILDHINDALEKNPQIIFINLTFSTLGVGFAKFCFNKSKDFSIHKALRKSIIFVEQIKKNNTIKAIPIVIFTSLVNFIQNEHQFFSLAFLYPIKEIENKKEPDYQSLKISLDNY